MWDTCTSHFGPKNLTGLAGGVREGLADFPAVFFHISHWYLSWNTTIIQGHGAKWCNGDCMWMNDQCVRGTHTHTHNLPFMLLLMIRLDRPTPWLVWSYHHSYSRKLESFLSRARSIWIRTLGKRCMWNSWYCRGQHYHDRRLRT